MKYFYYVRTGYIFNKKNSKNDIVKIMIFEIRKKNKPATPNMVSDPHKRFLSNMKIK